MEKYQIVETVGDADTAWGKAPADVSAVAERKGYRKLAIKERPDGGTVPGKLRKRAGFLWDWLQAMGKIKPGSLLLLQFPFQSRYYLYDRYLKALKGRGVKLVWLVHDVERLRGSYNTPGHERELLFMCAHADAVIVHNERMKDWFVKEGLLKAERLVSLEIFDYLSDETTENLPAAFAPALNIAGNLDPGKTGYLESLPALSGLEFELYGKNCPDRLKNAENVRWHGVAPAAKLPNLLCKGFGLVWDGGSPQTCSGDFGNYMRYNNPHKLSLYMAAGLPAVIWEEAAAAEYVRKYGTGITVASLQEACDRIAGSGAEETREAYESMREHALEAAGKVRSGFYTARALVAAEETACGNENI